MKNRTTATIVVAMFASFVLADTASAHYSPRLGRFLSRDPIEESGSVVIRQVAPLSQFIARDSTPDTAQDEERTDVYAYGSNGPINKVDPHGLLWLPSMRNDCNPCKLAVLAADTLEGDESAWWYFRFRSNCCSISGFATHPLLSGVSTVDEAIDRLCDQSCAGGVQEINVSGHGNAHGCRLPDGSYIGAGQLTPAQIARIQRCLGPNGAVVLNCCRTGDDPDRIQKLANELRRRVCGCKGPCSAGPCPQAQRVCRDPSS